MTSNILRQKFLDYFKSRHHAVMPSASLIPENDPSVLFTTAGMHPLVPYLLGESHPAGKRLASCQKCIRTSDIDEVGDNTHLTFFEMLGNWSLGDYFKQEAIDYSWKFITSNEGLMLDKSRLAFSVFAGDNDAPFDQEAYACWLELGANESRIARLGKADNWWGPAGQTGPCGPDTEVFYWSDDENPAPKIFDPADKRWVEIWNNVFMAYFKREDQSFQQLENTNVDTGLGLERVLMIMNNIDDVFQTDLFRPAINKLEAMSGKSYDDYHKEFRIICDHVRAATMIIGDDKGIGPSNTDQGYVVRKLIRRSLRYCRQLGIAETIPVTPALSEIFISILGDAYPEIKYNQIRIIKELANEEEKFKRTLANGLKQFDKLKTDISGHEAFDLYQTYGFPLEMTEELAKEKNLAVDSAGFAKEQIKHQDLSRTAAAGKFSGGLADHSDMTTKLHTATHLLLAALRIVLNDQVFQKGSNITAKRLRLDFSYPDKLTNEHINKLEILVNNSIDHHLPITCQEMSLIEAKKINAMGVFEAKYDARVKVYTIGEGDQVISREICGGPHVENTGVLGKFKIIREEASSAGVRRIKAILE